jgi:CubicO group peptidase (beta-lactamase class C family)
MRMAVFLALCLDLSVAGPGFGEDSEQRLDRGLDRGVDRVFASYAKSDSPGCAVGVIQDGNFVYRKGYGMGSLEQGVPLSPESVFYMGSIAKQFTAASIVLAAEEGFLSLDDNIRKYIPELPDYGQPITLREMLHHTSGLADFLGLIGISGRNLEDLHPTAELMDLIVRQKALNFHPGDEFLYSNTNYFLLAEVVKRATKMPLREFAAQNIFKPLGMAHTRFYDDHTVVVPGRVAGYSRGTGGAFLVDWSTNYEIVGGGGLMSSVDDLLMWDRNFYHNMLGKTTFLKEMQAREALNDGTANNYALGQFMSTYRGLPIAEHSGANFGYRTNLLRFPQQNFTVVTLCNVSSADPAGLSREVADIYLEKELQPAPAGVAGSDPVLFAGKYFETRTHYLVSFTAERGNLVLEGHVLEPVERNRFADPTSGATVTFSSADGVMKASVTYNNALTFAGARIEALHVDGTALAAYAGVYKSAELDATYKLSLENGSLMLRAGWDPAIKLEPIVPNEFSVGGGLTLVFTGDNAGHISGLKVFSGWDGAIRNERFEKLN